MSYNNLPKQIISPFTGQILYLKPLGYPNEIEGVKVENHVHTHYGGGNFGDWYAGPLAMYRATDEIGSEVLFYPIN